MRAFFGDCRALFGGYRAKNGGKPGLHDFLTSYLHVYLSRCRSEWEYQVKAGAEAVHRRATGSAPVADHVQPAAGPERLAHLVGPRPVQAVLDPRE